ncbi:MAG: hypothetical protein D6753_08315, partial [Planctomycetota bacterium]
METRRNSAAEDDLHTAPGGVHHRHELPAVAHFKLDRLLGEGGFGSVWLAHDTRLNRAVALKLPNNPDASLLHEAQTAARLRHPHIVSIYEVGIEQGQVYIASEYIEGTTLRDELMQQVIGVTRSVDLMYTIAQAAHHAHQQGVVHRDMKPGNVMVDGQGQPFIMDFGIAKSMTDDETISSEGQIVGTVAYMAPEQAAGKNARTDHRADIYSMGVILFELLTGHRPFRGTVQGILYQKNNNDPPSPCSLVPNLPRDLETICLKCLEREPDKRYQTAQDLADELERVRQNVPILARPVSRVEKLWRWCLRNPMLASSTAAILLLVTCFATVGWYLWGVAEHNRSLTRKTLYRAHMVLASNAYAAGDFEALDAALQPYALPGNGALRDFAWYYFQHARQPVSRTLHLGGPITNVSVSRDGRLVAASQFNEPTVQVWSVEDGRPMRELAVSGRRCVALAFSAVGNRLLTAANNGTIRIWNPQA